MEILGICLNGCERWQVAYALGGHLAEDFLRPPEAVLDRIDSSLDRTPHPFGGGSVGGHQATGRMGFLHQCPELFDAEGGHLLASWAAAVIGIDLDPVRTHARLLPHRLQYFGDSR